MFLVKNTHCRGSYLKVYVWVTVSQLLENHCTLCQIPSFSYPFAACAGLDTGRETKAMAFSEGVKTERWNTVKKLWKEIAGELTRRPGGKERMCKSDGRRVAEKQISGQSRSQERLMKMRDSSDMDQRNRETLEGLRIGKESRKQGEKARKERGRGRK